MRKHHTTHVVLGAAFAFGLTLLTSLVSRKLPGNEAFASFFTFVGAAVVSLVPLALAGKTVASNRALVFTAVCGLAFVSLGYFARETRWHAPTLNTGLFLVAHAIGHAIGSRVMHGGHLLPACVVAACADVLSVFHPSGPTHAALQSETALSLLAVHFPVPSTTQSAPALGVGDLVFVALIVGAAAKHTIPYARVSLACALGVLLAGLLSGLTGAPVPALVSVSASVLALVPEARAVPPKDKALSRLAIASALTLTIAVLVKRYWGSAL